MTLDELSYILETELEVSTHLDTSSNKVSFHVKFPYSEIKEGGVLTTASGFGKTLTQARKNLCRNLAGKRLVFNAYNMDKRREYNIPPTLR